MSGKIFDIITLGSNVVDTFVRTSPEESDLIRIKHGKLSEQELVAYPLGTKILIDHLEFQIGGGGTNTAVACARLGLNTAYAGKIGKDENGLKVFAGLKGEGVKFIGSLGAQNGFSVILDSVGDDRTILTYKGCNNELSFKELKKDQLKAKAYYLCSMTGDSYKALEAMAKHARKQKALVAFNPSSYLVKQGAKGLGAALKATDVLILNEEEATCLVGMGEDEELATRIAALGPKSVVITKGCEGVMALHKATIYRAKPPKGLRIHETTGAGDAFGSTLIAGMVMGKPFKECLKMAMINAESVIANYGAKNILLSLDALEKKTKADKRPIKQTKRGR